MKKKIFLFFLFLINIVCFSVTTYDDIITIPNPIINNQGRVIDQAEILKEDELKDINKKFESSLKYQKTEIVLLIFKEYQGDFYKACEYLQNAWQLGKEVNNKAIITIASLDNKMLVTYMTKESSGMLAPEIVTFLRDNIVIPQFNNGQYAYGIKQYCNELTIFLASEYMQKDLLRKIALESDSKKNSNKIKLNLSKDNVLIIIIFFILTLAFYIYGFINLFKEFKSVNYKKENTDYQTIVSMQNKGSSKVLRTVWASLIAVFTFFFMSLGLLGINLINNNYLWILQIIPLIFTADAIIGVTVYNYKKNSIIKNWRQTPRRCPACQNIMEKQTEENEDKYLKDIQIEEEKIKTADYDVHLCKSCNNVIIEKYLGWRSSFYFTCELCKSIAAYEKNIKVLQKPTYLKEGSENITYFCNACKKTYNRTYPIPKLVSQKNKKY